MFYIVMNESQNLPQACVRSHDLLCEKNQILLWSKCVHLGKRSKQFVWLLSINSWLCFWSTYSHLSIYVLITKNLAIKNPRLFTLLYNDDVGLWVPSIHWSFCICDWKYSSFSLNWIPAPIREYPKLHLLPWPCPKIMTALSAHVLLCCSNPWN
jgi:hypothetical protein